jgi:hypothetical protein
LALRNGSDLYLDTTAGALVFRGASNAERGRFDSSGRLLVGTSSTLNANRPLQVAGLGFELIHGSADAIGPTINLSKARTSVASPFIVSGGDVLGNVDFSGYDGLSYKVGARVHAIIDNAPGNNDLPTALVFSTTADGASSPTERMRITSGGQVLIGRTSVVSGYNSTLSLDPTIA